MSKIEGFVRVHPFGASQKVLVYVSDKKAMDEDKVVEALRAAGSDLRLRKIARA